MDKVVWRGVENRNHRQSISSGFVWAVQQGAKELVKKALEFLEVEWRTKGDRLYS